MKSWSGQELTHKDFSMENTWYEIKTIGCGQQNIKISSLEQLDSVYDGEIVVFQQTTPGVFHGYVVPWDKLSDDIKNALIRSGLVNRKGKIK